MLENKNFSVACLSAVLLTVASEAAFTKSFNHMQAHDVYHMPDGKMSMSQVLTPPHSATLSQIGTRAKLPKDIKQLYVSAKDLKPAKHGEMEADRCPGLPDDHEEKTPQSLAQKRRQALAAIKASDIDPSEITVTYNRSQQNNLAQIQMSQKHCTSAIDQRKEQLPDFASIVTQSQDWLDPYFGQVKDSIYWDGVDQWNVNMYSAEQRTEWKKADTIEGAKLWGTSGQLANLDVNQGGIGNCYFLAAVAAIAEKPERIQNIFLNQSNDLNAAGIYGVNLYSLGIPHTVIVDDYLPLEISWNGNWSTVFSKIGNDKAMWMPILEKAFAKLNGNYSHTIAGDPTSAAEQIMGGMSRTNYHKRDDGGLSASEKATLWEQMMAHNTDGGMMWTGTPGSSDSDANSEDLYNNHAYVVQHVQETSWGLKMVRIRNPHGKDNFKGKYSDHESRAGDWTQELRDELDYQVSSMDDGVIHMEWDYYLANCEYTQFGEDTTGWFTSSYLKMDDNSLATDSSKAGQLSWCQGCTRHVMKVKSTVAQKVYLSGNTWPKRFYPQSNTCLDNSVAHYMSEPENPYMYSGWSYGQNNVPAVEMAAGQEIEIVMEMDLSGESIKKDWSLVAWSELGAVEITNSDGTASETLPFIARSSDGSDNSSTDGGDNSNTDGGDNSNTDGGDNSNTDGGDNSNTDSGDNSNTDGGDNSNTDGGDNSGTDGGDNSGTDGGDNSGTDGGDNSGTDGGDNSGTDGGDNSGAWEPSKEQRRFNKKVQKYQPGAGKDWCSGGLKERYDRKNDAWFASFYNGCHEIGWNLIFTILIDTDEYEGWQITYETEDKMSDFQCEQYDDEQTECTIEVGAIQDWESKGLRGELNDWAGFLTRPGDWGVNNYSTEWVQI